MARKPLAPAPTDDGAAFDAASALAPPAHKLPPTPVPIPPVLFAFAGRGSGCVVTRRDPDDIDSPRLFGRALRSYPLVAGSNGVAVGRRGFVLDGLYEMIEVWGEVPLRFDAPWPVGSYCRCVSPSGTPLHLTQWLPIGASLAAAGAPDPLVYTPEGRAAAWAWRLELRRLGAEPLPTVEDAHATIRSLSAHVESYSRNSPTESRLVRAFAAANGVDLSAAPSTSTADPAAERGRAMLQADLDWLRALVAEHAGDRTVFAPPESEMPASAPFLGGFEGAA